MEDDRDDDVALVVIIAETARHAVARNGACGHPMVVVAPRRRNRNARSRQPRLPKDDAPALPRKKYLCHGNRTRLSRVAPAAGGRVRPKNENYPRLEEHQRRASPAALTLPVVNSGRGAVSVPRSRLLGKKKEKKTDFFSPPRGTWSAYMLNSR